MEQNFSSTMLPTVGTASAASTNGINWSNPSRITADDGSSAAYSAAGFGGDQGAKITGSAFGFQKLPDSAVIDGIEVVVDGAQSSASGDVTLNIAGSVPKSIGALNNSYGSNTDLWGVTSITNAQIAALTVSVTANDVSGGDATASIDYMSVTVFWHIEMPNIPNDDVPTRIDYQVYSRDGNFLGLLPKVTTKLAFPQDINSAGTPIVVKCGRFVNNETVVTPLLTEAGDIITTENDLPILTTSTELLVTTGNSPDEAIFKNSNRVKAWLHNRYYPNGKLIFSGQVNRVELEYGGSDPTVKLTILSDGIDMNNLVARGYPFTYTTDVTQSAFDGSAIVATDAAGTWQRYGQTWRTGPSADNVGALVLKLRGTADVTVSVYDAPNGNFIGSNTQSVNLAVATDVQFEFAQLLGTDPDTEVFAAVSVGNNQAIRVYTSSANPYADGSVYAAFYSSGSGGGTYTASPGADFYFITKYGTPTTTATYSDDDPVTDMAHGIMLDYNARGGLIRERDFEAAGLLLTYTFVVAFVYDALKKIIELSPAGYYFYVDLGTAELDIKQISTTADFTVVRSRHINKLSLALSIEQVKNYLLQSGGDIGGGVNLFRDYGDNESVSNYGIRTATKSDNRITLVETSDAVGESFIEENSQERQETTLIIKDEFVDITQFVPGKTVGFKNFGNFIDDMVLQIVRREPNFSDGIATLTLGRLPVRLSDEIQRINRDLLNEQTINNPSAPS